MSQWSPSSFSALVGSQPHPHLKACERVCYLDVLSYLHLHLLLEFTSIPHYCSHGTFAVTEITKTGFLCIILFCLASWWCCNVKALSKYTQTLQKKCHHKTTQPCQGSSVNMYNLYTVRRERHTRMYIIKCWLSKNSMSYLFKCYHLPIPLHCNLSIVISF